MSGTFITAEQHTEAVLRLLTEIERLEAQNEQLRRKVAIGHTVERFIYKDAKRYRFIRDCETASVYIPHIWSYEPEVLDNTIDAAMRDEEEL